MCDVILASLWSYVQGFCSLAVPIPLLQTDVGAQLSRLLGIVFISHFIGHVFKLISTQTGYKIYLFFHFFEFLYLFCFITVLFHFNELFIFLKVCLLSLFCSKRLKFL